MLNKFQIQLMKLEYLDYVWETIFKQRNEREMQLMKQRICLVGNWVKAEVGVGVGVGIRRTTCQHHGTGPEF